VLTGTGCSTARRSMKTLINKNEGASLNDISGDIQKLNITNTNFYIQKAEIEVINDKKKQKLLGTVKYKNPGEYLVSLRSRAGIEAARFYINKDTILINDRINRKLYYGSAEYLERKYGITSSFLPILLGDFREGNDIASDNNRCVKGNLEAEKEIRNNKIVFNIDCNILKVSKIIVKDYFDSETINLAFDRFSNNGQVIFPQSIIIKDLTNNFSINISIDKVEIPWDGVIDFIQGKNYEVERLR